MNKAIANILNKVLGDWVENLNPEQLNLSVFKGKIEFHNLQLKPSAFSKLGLPFDLSTGFIGHIVVDIPWTSLSTKPLIVHIDDIFALLRPKPTESWSSEELQKIFFSSQSESLSNFEALHQPELVIANDPGFIEKLVENIVDNVQIKISKIYFRYEDSITAKYPFALGVKLLGITAETCNSSWKPMYVKESKKCFKSLKIVDLSVFLDCKDGVLSCNHFFKGKGNSFVETAKIDFEGGIEHKLVLTPLSVNVQAVVNKVTVADEPKISIKIEQDLLGVQMFMEHIGYVVKVLDFIQLFNVFKAGIAKSCALKTLEADDAKNKYKEMYLEWRAQKLKDEKSHKTVGFKQKLEDFEKEFTAESLNNERNIAIQEQLLNKKLHEKEKEAKSLLTKDTGFKLSGIFESKTETQRREAEEEKQKNAKLIKIQKEISLISEEKKKLQDKPMVSEAVIEDEMLFFLEFKLHKAVFSVYDPKLLISSEFNQFEFRLGINKSSQLVRVYLNSFVIKDHKNLSDLLPWVINSRSAEFVYETRKIFLSTSGMDVVVNILPLLNLINELKSEISEHIDLDKIFSEASLKTNEYIKSGESYVKNIVKNGAIASILLDINITAPVIYIPNKEINAVLAVDLGKLQIKSSKDQGKHLSFDHYLINITDIKVATLWNPKSLKNYKRFTEILRPTHIKTSIKLYPRPDKLKPGFKIAVEISEFLWKISNQQIYFILDLISLIKPNENSEERVIVVESADVKEWAKEIGEILPWKFSFKCGMFEIKIFDQENSIAEVKIGEIETNVGINKESELNMSISIEDCMAVDPCAEVFTNILEKNVTNTREKTKYFCKIAAFFSLSKGIINASLALTDISLIASTDFIYKLAKYSTEILQKLPKSRPSIRAPVSFSFISAKNYFSLRVTGISLCLPLSLSDPSTKILNLSTSAMIFYESTSKGKKTYDYLWRECSSEVSESTESGGITLSHLSISIKTREELINYILNPSRLSLDYSSLKNPSTAEQKVDIRLESLIFAIGFYDINYLQQVIKNYTPAKSESKSTQPPVVQSSTFFLNIDGDSFQINLIKDTESSVISICHFQFSNIGLLAKLAPTSKALNFSTLIVSACFNQELGSWEPMIEDYKINLTLLQNSLDAPLLITLESPEFLNVNISASVITVLSTVLANLNLEIDSNSKKAREEVKTKAVFEYEIVNCVGCTLAAKVDIEGNHDWWTILPAKSIRFSQNYVDQLFTISNSHMKSTSVSYGIQTQSSLCLEIGKFQSISGLVIEEVGISGFVVQNEQSSASCVMEVTSFGNLRQIRIIPGLQLCNNTDQVLKFEYDQEIIEVLENSSSPGPLHWNGDYKNISILTPEKQELNYNKFVDVLGKHYVLEIYEYQTDTVVPYLALVISPCYSVVNSLPCDMSIIFDEIELCRVKSGEECFLDGIDSKKAVSIRICLYLDQGELTSELVEIPQKDLVVPLVGYTKTSVKLEVASLDFRKNSFANVSNCNRVHIENGVFCKQLQFYSEHIIVNQTDHNLSISGMELSKHSWGLFDPKKAKLKSSDFPSKSSENFSLETVSVAGFLSIPHSSENYELTLGVLISLGTNSISQSKIVTISPRYMVSNFLKSTIYIKTVGRENSLKVQSQEVIPFVSEEENPGVQISSDGINWSGAFSLEDIEDFQICFARGQLKKINPQKLWKLSKWSHRNLQYVRVMKYTKNEATIHISFIKPKDPEFVIVNNTKEVINVWQKEVEGGGTLEVHPGTTSPWCFGNYLIKEKRIILNIGNLQKDFSLEKIKKCKNLGDYMVEVVVQGVTREIRVSSEEFVEGNKEVIKVAPVLNFKIHANLAGVGVSIMDLKNNEELYISLSNILVKYKFAQVLHKDHSTNSVKFDVQVENFQIDNMEKTGALFPVILSKFKMTSDQEEYTPFLQLKVHKETTISLKTSISLQKLKWLELSIHPLQVNINEETIYTLLNLKYLFSLFSSTSEIFVIDTSYPPLPYKISEIGRKAYFEFLRLCAIKIEVNFRKASKILSISLKSGLGVLRILSTIGGAFANISETPLKFNEVLVTHGFQTIPSLTSSLLKNYIRQGILQLYKLLGSSDMLGNPLGLIDKLGTGVFEFVTEPAKGLLKGPKAFASGVGKGVKSLVGGIISGGFGSVSKITGSLYNVVKELGGDLPELDRRQSNIGVFMYEGFKGGIMDVADGVTGVFTKPFKGAKDKGAKGFVKGVGSGLFGLVSSPVKLVLKFGSTITSGIAKSATLLTKGKVHRFGRMRFPRQLGPKRVLEQYDPDVAQAQGLLLAEGQNQHIVYYAHYTEERDIIIIVTNKLFWVLVDAETKAKFSLKHIDHMELHMAHNLFILDCHSKEGSIKVSGHSFGKLATGYFAVLSMLGVSQISKKHKKDKSRCCF